MRFCQANDLCAVGGADPPETRATFQINWVASFGIHQNKADFFLAGFENQVAVSSAQVKVPIIRELTKVLIYFYFGQLRNPDHASSHSETGTTGFVPGLACVDRDGLSDQESCPGDPCLIPISGFNGLMSQDDQVRPGLFDAQRIHQLFPFGLRSLSKPWVES